MEQQRQPNEPKDSSRLSAPHAFDRRGDSHREPPFAATPTSNSDPLAEVIVRSFDLPQE